MTLLNHDLIRSEGADAERWLLFLHGIYGAGRNWNSVARKVIGGRAGWGAAMIDLREHGESIGFEPPHTLEAAAGDVLQLARELDAPAGGVVGHSFGGKVALMLVRLMSGGQVPAGDAGSPPAGVDEGGAPPAEGAIAGSAGKPFEVWVIDSTPEAREPAGSAWQMLDVLRAVPGPFAERGEAVRQLEQRGVARPTAQWISTNLEREGDTLRWRLDLDVMEQLLRDFFATDLWDVVEAPPEGVEIHVVRASESSVLGPDSVERVRAAASSGRVHYHEVEGGHWLNADNPDALVELMTGSRQR